MGGVQCPLALHTTQNTHPHTPYTQRQTKYTKTDVTSQGTVHKHVKTHRSNEPRLPLRPPSAMRPSEKYKRADRRVQPIKATLLVYRQTHTKVDGEIPTKPRAGRQVESTQAPGASRQQAGTNSCLGGLTHAALRRSWCQP